MSVRIQRRRTKGWRMPEGAVYVGRPSRWGNPFAWDGENAPWMALALGERADVAGRRAAAVKLYRWWMTGADPATFPVATDDSGESSEIEYSDGTIRTVRDIATGMGLMMWLREPLKIPPRPDLSPLHGHDLACYCPDGQPCQGGTLASIFQRDKRRCWICGHAVRKAEATRDHVEPRSLGGYDKAKNYKLAHDRCNVARGNLSEAVVAAIQKAMPSASAEAIRHALSAARQQRRKVRV